MFRIILVVLTTLTMFGCQGGKMKNQTIENCNHSRMHYQGTYATCKICWKKWALVETDKLTCIIEELEDSRKLAAFYANDANWVMHKKKGLVMEITTIKSLDASMIAKEDHSVKLGGKTARKHLNKWGLEK